MYKPTETNPTNLTYFEKQRDILITEINNQMISVITNLNTLNRSLKANIAVGKEFDVVAEQWKSFYDSFEHIQQVREEQERQRQKEQTTVEESLIPSGVLTSETNVQPSIEQQSFESDAHTIVPDQTAESQPSAQNDFAGTQDTAVDE